MQRNILSKMTLGLAGTLIGVTPMLASAHPRIDLDLAVGPVAPLFTPAPPPAVVVTAPADRVWVEPVYRTVTDRVWRDEATEDRCVRVWVPDAYVDQVFGYGRHERVERVLVPGHYEDRHETVVVAPGHWEDVQRQVLVTPGHWEDCGPRVVEVAPPPPAPRFATFFGFRF